MNIVTFNNKKYEIVFDDEIIVKPDNDIIKTLSNSEGFNDYTFEQDEGTFIRLLQIELENIEKCGQSLFYH